MRDTGSGEVIRDRIQNLDAEGSDTAGLGFNSALVRGLEILRSFDIEDSYLGNKELSAKTGIPKATVSRLTAALCHLGYLNFSESRQKYELSPGILSLAHVVLSKARIRSLAIPAMARLATEANATVNLGTLDRLSAISIEVVDSANAVTHGHSIGRRVPLGRSATGFACLAAMRPAEREAVMKKLEAQNPEAWPDTHVRIEHALSCFWSDGFYVSEGFLEPDFNAVSVPFHAFGDEHIYAFTMFAPRLQISRDELQNIWGKKLLDLVGSMRGGQPRMD